MPFSEIANKSAILLTQWIPLPIGALVGSVLLLSDSVSDLRKSTVLAEEPEQLHLQLRYERLKRFFLAILTVGFALYYSYFQFLF